MSADHGTAQEKTDSLERSKLELDKWRAEEDIKLRRQELEIKRGELSKSRWSSPLLLAVIGLIASVIVNIVQNFVQSSASTKLERQRFESGIIQKAVETPDQQDAADRLKFLLDLGLIADPNGKIADYVKNPETIPVQPQGDTFQGVARKAAKLSVGTGPVENFKNLSDLVASLPSEAVMASHEPPITTESNSGRVAEEQRNVHVRAFLYAASKQKSNDYHMVIGAAPGVQPAIYITTIVSGLPPEKNDPAYPKLKAARDACEKFFEKHLPGGTYSFYSPPIPVEIEGSLFFNISFLKGARPGPASLREGTKTIWEIRPVTKIVFEPKP